MATLPDSVALTSIATDASIVSSDHRNNYSTVQAFLNALRTILAGGTSGDVLTSGGGTTVSWSASAFVGVRSTATASQSIANSTITAVVFDSETDGFDTDTMHDTVTNNTRLTVPASKGGKYQIAAQMLFDGNATGTREIWIRKNGSDSLTSKPGYRRFTADANGNSLQTFDVLDLSAADYLEVVVRQSSGGALAIGSAADFRPLVSMIKVG